MADLKDLILQGTLTIEGNATFMADVEVKGRLALSNQQAGYADIPAGGQEVEVLFTKSFSEEPLIQATLENGIAAHGIFAKTTKGFVIKIATPATEKIRFNWLAIPVADTRTAVGKVAGTARQEPASEIPEPSAEPVTSGTPATSEAQASPIIPTPSPEATPVAANLNPESTVVPETNVSDN